MGSMLKYIVRAVVLLSVTILLCFLVALGVVLLSQAVHASTSTPNRPNSLGLDEVYTNPNVYLFAVIACQGDGDCSILTDEKGRKYTNLKFQPYNTMELYAEPVLFCDNVAEFFNGKSGPLVITYRRQATLKYRGLGCHELDSVFEVHAQ